MTARTVASSYVSTFMNWGHAHGVLGYEAWTWDTWGNCGALISSYTGTPGNADGQLGAEPLRRAMIPFGVLG
jgi:hypothetical protein